MSGTADDDDYWVPPGTVIVMVYGPDGPAAQPIDGALCKRPTVRRDAADLESALVKERRIYEQRMTGSGGSIPSLRPRRSPPPIPKARPAAQAIPAIRDYVDVVLSDLLLEDS